MTRDGFEPEGEEVECIEIHKKCQQLLNQMNAEEELKAEEMFELLLDSSPVPNDEAEESYFEENGQTSICEEDTEEEAKEEESDENDEHKEMEQEESNATKKRPLQKGEAKEKPGSAKKTKTEDNEDAGSEEEPHSPKSTGSLSLSLSEASSSSSSTSSDDDSDSDEMEGEKEGREHDEEGGEDQQKDDSEVTMGKGEKNPEEADETGLRKQYPKTNLKRWSKTRWSTPIPNNGQWSYEVRLADFLNKKQSTIPDLCKARVTCMCFKCVFVFVLCDSLVDVGSFIIRYHEHIYVGLGTIDTSYPVTCTGSG